VAASEIAEALVKEGDDFVPSTQGRLTLSIDKIKGHHAMRRRYMLVEKWRASSSNGRWIRQHPPIEARAERFGIGREPFSPTKGVPRETVAQHAEVLPFQPLCDLAELIAGVLKTRGIVKREGRLADDGCQHRRLQHHRQREIAGETHADSAHARSAALAMGDTGEPSKP
jgi:hypothetical protein